MDHVLSAARWPQVKTLVLLLTFKSEAMLEVPRPEVVVVFVRSTTVNLSQSTDAKSRKSMTLPYTSALPSSAFAHFFTFPKLAGRKEIT